jgi:hypothetical protein
VTAGAVFLAFVLATHGNLALKATLVVLESVGAYVAGYHLGRMAGFGRLGPFLRARDCMPKVRPGHLDGMGGLKPVGDFYFFQAMVVAIPGHSSPCGGSSSSWAGTTTATTAGRPPTPACLPSPS